MELLPSSLRASLIVGQWACLQLSRSFCLRSGALIWVLIQQIVRCFCNVACRSDNFTELLSCATNLLHYSTHFSCMCVNFDLAMFYIYPCATYELRMWMERNGNGVMAMGISYNIGNGNGKDVNGLNGSGKQRDSESLFPSMLNARTDKTRQSMTDLKDCLWMSTLVHARILTSCWLATVLALLAVLCVA